MKPTFTICYPKDKYDMTVPLENGFWSTGKSPQKILYDNLEIVLNDMGYKYEFIHKKYNIPNKFSGDICFGYHTIGYRKNVWHLKDGQVGGYWDFDTHGHAGWSRITTSEEMFRESQSVDLDQAREFVDNFLKIYKKDNSSKYIQPDQNISLDIEQPYVFFPGQILQDSVIKKFSKVDPIQHSKKVVSCLDNAGYKIIFKKHPGLLTSKNRTGVDIKHPNVVNFSGSIHDVIPNSSGVVVINSGVGFESLLYKKHVFVSGVCDYHWAAHKIYTIGDIQKIPDILNTPVNEEKIIKFVYYMLTEVYVDSNDLNSIRKKLEKVIKIYEGNK